MKRADVNINITLPKALHRRLKLDALKKNTTLKNRVIAILKKKAEER